MKLVLDILQGIGLACAAGLRPFLPTLAAGGFASANLGVDFDNTPFSFLESPAFLLAGALVMVLTVLLRGRLATPARAAARSGVGLRRRRLLLAAPPRRHH